MPEGMVLAEELSSSDFFYEASKAEEASALLDGCRNEERET